MQCARVYLRARAGVCVRVCVCGGLDIEIGGWTKQRHLRGVRRMLEITLANLRLANVRNIGKPMPKSNGNSSTSLYYISLSLGFGHMCKYRNPNDNTKTICWAIIYGKRGVPGKCPR